MSINNISAIILNVSPYRETSCILKLFSPEYGLITGIAKGVKKLKSRREPLERGSHINLTVYFKKNRDINTVSNIHIIDFFPGIRSNLQKTAIRDITFELIIASIINYNPQRELYSTLLKFLSQLEQLSETHTLYIQLWRFFYKFADISGFVPDFSQCIYCGTPIKESGYLLINKGGVSCRNCCKNDFSDPDCFIPERLFYILASSILPSDNIPSFGSAELLRITRLAVSYCRYHLDIHREFKSLNFLEHLILSEKNCTSHIAGF